MTSASDSYLRPLFSDFAADRRVQDTADEFMLGRSILATPILTPQYTEEKIIKEDAMTGWDKYVGERTWAGLGLRVYPGADGTSTLYEEEGDNYEKGQYATISLNWNDRARQLTIGERQGSYQGMLGSRSLTVTPPEGQTKEASYYGSTVVVSL